ncbi:hypothetical protein BaRGS_00031541 [Batillaria attramentaria]|uniref:Uncharacterized protein n=1 Tax=Batillaria attramentaria TaxID=370345 RepID=A0ABD0JQA8_9CAEN
MLVNALRADAGLCGRKLANLANLHHSSSGNYNADQPSQPAHKQVLHLLNQEEKTSKKKNYRPPCSVSYTGACMTSAYPSLTVSTGPNNYISPSSPKNCPGAQVAICRTLIRIPSSSPNSVLWVSTCHKLFFPLGCLPEVFQRCPPK